MRTMEIMGKPDGTVAQRLSIVSEMLKNDRAYATYGTYGQKTEKNDNMSVQRLSIVSEMLKDDENRRLFRSSLNTRSCLREAKNIMFNGTLTLGVGCPKRVLLQRRPCRTAVSPATAGRVGVSKMRVTGVRNVRVSPATAGRVGVSKMRVTGVQNVRVSPATAGREGGQNVRLV